MTTIHYYVKNNTLDTQEKRLITNLDYNLQSSIYLGVNYVYLAIEFLNMKIK